MVNRGLLADRFMRVLCSGPDDITGTGCDGPKRLGNLSDELGNLDQTSPVDVIAEATNLCEPTDQFVIAQRLDIGN